MRRSRRPIVIASRRSQLARAQAEAVGRALSLMHPAVAVEYRWVESEGDVVADRPLNQSGGKGLFAAAIEREVLAGRADLAIHSLKDLPAQETPGLAIAAVPQRADARDCLVTRHGANTIDGLPHAAMFGTASPRRGAQVLRVRPDVQLKLIRGNVETRLKKVVDPATGGEHYDATLLAVAGLQRSGLGEWAVHVVDPDVILPAASQGALALQCRSDDHVTLSRCLPMNDPVTANAVHIERGVVAGLNGSCDSPIAAYAQATPEGVRLRVRVLSKDGTQLVSFDETAGARAAGKLVQRALRSLLDGGAVAVLGA